jgi:hypothetical protein
MLLTVSCQNVNSFYLLTRPRDLYSSLNISKLRWMSLGRHEGNETSLLNFSQKTCGEETAWNIAYWCRWEDNRGEISKLRLCAADVT